MRVPRDFRPNYHNTIIYMPNMRAPRDSRPDYNNTIIYKPNKKISLGLTRTITAKMTLFQAWLNKIHACNSKTKHTTKQIIKVLAQLLILIIYIHFLHYYMQHKYRTYLIQMYKQQSVEKCVCKSVEEQKYVLRVEELKSARERTRK